MIHTKIALQRGLTQLFCFLNDLDKVVALNFASN